MSEIRMSIAVPRPVPNNDPPPDPTQTDDTTKTGSLPVEGADEPVNDGQ